MNTSFLKVLVLFALSISGLQAGAVNLECKRIGNPTVLYTITDLTFGGVKSTWEGHVTYNFSGKLTAFENGVWKTSPLTELGYARVSEGKFMFSTSLTKYSNSIT